MNASFASRVLALKARRASATDSLFDLLNALVDGRVEGLDWVPLVATVGAILGALKRPVQSFGGALADGDVVITSASSDRADLSASLADAGCRESLAEGVIDSLADRVSAESEAVCSETTVPARVTALGIAGRIGTAGVCFGSCLTWVGVAGVTGK
jgi:hypothetical protein